jgi:GntR family transcriptional regulator
MRKKEKTSDPTLADGDSPLPLYHRLYVILRERIVNGDYRAGHVLPSEADLMASFGVSRITVKRALDDLAKDGLVERSRGRGTTVTQAGASLRVGSPISASIDGLLTSLSVIGQGTSVEIDAFEYQPASPYVAEQLRIPAGTIIQRASRVRHLHDEPFSHSTSYVLESIGRSYTAKDMVAKPLIDLLQRSVTISQVQQAITCTLADNVSAKLLKVSVGSPLLKLRRIFIDADGRPVDYAEILYTPDRFEYRMTWTRNANNQLEVDTAGSAVSL